MHRSTRRCAVVLLLLAGSTGCRPVFVPSPFEVPVECRSVTVIMGSRGALHDRAGVYYELANVSLRTIVRLDLAFDLYDDRGSPVPRAGANSYRVALESVISPGSTARYCTSLDSVVREHADAVTPVRFRVRSVVFDDGSTWRNLRGFVFTEDL